METKPEQQQTQHNESNYNNGISNGNGNEERVCFNIFLFLEIILCIFFCEFLKFGKSFCQESSKNFSDFDHIL